jgi:hypothetical protein
VNELSSNLDAARDRLRSETPARDVLSPREVAQRSGFSYHAVLRAIRRGDLHVSEPVPGRYRIELAEYERWLRTPPRPRASAAEQRPRSRTRAPDRGSLGALRAIEGR